MLRSQQLRSNASGATAYSTCILVSAAFPFATGLLVLLAWHSNVGISNGGFLELRKEHDTNERADARQLVESEFGDNCTPVENVGAYQQNIHYVLCTLDRNINKTHIVSWVPVGTMCHLPVPMPYFGEVTMGIAKIGVSSAVFNIEGPHHWDKAIGLWTLVFRYAYACYQVVSIPRSVFLTVNHWYDKNYLTQWSWDGYECLGAMIYTAPYISNAILLAVQYVLVREQLRHMRAWSEGAANLEAVWTHGADWQSGVSTPKNGYCGRGLHTEIKLKILYVLLCINVLVVLISAPYVVTHILPAMIFLPELLLMLAVGVVVSYKLGARDAYNLVFGPAIEGRDEYERATSYLMQLAKTVSSKHLKHPGKTYGYLMKFGKKMARSEQGQQLAHAGQQLAHAGVGLLQGKPGLDQEDKANESVAKAEEVAEQMTWLIFKLMPILLAVKVWFEVAFLQAANLYDGHNYIAAMVIVWTERRLGRYIKNTFWNVLDSVWPWATSNFFSQVL